MNITCVDLEFNKPYNEIIQIGAVVGNILTGEIVEELNIVVKTSNLLDPFIITLTGITQDRTDGGVELIDAYKKLKDIHERHKSLMNPITWGGGDSYHLFNELKKHYSEQFITQEDKNIWCFGRRWIDAKTLFVSYCLINNLKIQSGLKKSCHRMGLIFEGPAHNALQDAKATFEIYKKLIEFFKK